MLDKIVITGGAGFVGANLARHLVESGSAASVVAYDNLTTGFAANVAGIDGVTLVEGDILDQDHLTGVLSGADAVVHLAARPSVPKSIEDPIASHDNNATGTIRVLEPCARPGSDASSPPRHRRSTGPIRRCPRSRRSSPCRSVPTP